LRFFRARISPIAGADIYFDTFASLSPNNGEGWAMHRLLVAFTFSSLSLRFFFMPKWFSGRFVPLIDLVSTNSVLLCHYWSIHRTVVVKLGLFLVLRLLVPVS
jgi:hypothetical protein